MVKADNPVEILMQAIVKGCSVNSRQRGVGSIVNTPPARGWWFF